MISVDEALSLLLELAAPIGTEHVPLRHARGRVLARPVVARRNQPPFTASVMDGYAVIDADVRPGARLSVIGEAAAGHGFDGRIGPGEALRIFTGAPVPEGATRVIIQEDVRREGGIITLNPDCDSSKYIRGIGADFKVGDTVDAPRHLTPSDLALIAAMNVPDVTVARKPVVALIATGDELVMPGEDPGQDQIIASNTFGIAAVLEQEGAEVRALPIARDTRESLATCFDLAAGADLVVTIGGASVGDHDLVGEVAADRGMDRSFYKIAMRPGKPLMAGHLGDMPMVGLPGNPVSSMVCAHIFLRPMIRAMLGLPARTPTMRTAPLAAPLGANGPRQHYMRARLDGGKVFVAERQDSALLSVLSQANILAVRKPHAPALGAGEPVSYIEL